MLKFLRTAQVIYILTEQKRQEMNKEFKEKKMQAEKELAQFTFQMKKSMSSHKNERHRHVRLEEECLKKEEQIIALTFQLEQLALLPLGAELKGEKLESIHEINIGDKWTSSDKPIEIIVEDGVIIDIRESGKNHDRIF
ncbi:YlqD family protein [Bacillus sp. FJAT-45037]|uniref:YlqD family protein n=1 Tax=Bacillus sp. FJAT-45037 TaxID=2011007 RepID=UPI000C24E7B3|nr:YlqD family protein [Bacillus sp. FJAT-45037]